MSYLDAYISGCQGWGWQGGPSFSTNIVSMKTGAERRNADQAFARHQYTTKFLNIGKDEYASIKQMHLVARGQLHAFKWRDFLDYQAVNEIFGDGDGVTKTFQLRKVSTIGGVSYIRNTYIISSDLAPAITINGVAAGPYTIDADRGLITFGTAPVNNATLAGTWNFDVWVRFAQDDLPFTLDAPNAINGSISLIELPPPPLS